VIGTFQLDRAMLCSLAVHEARLQATGERELRDLGDGVLLLDRLDPEPYWNRLVAVDWPGDPDEFAERLGTAITSFRALGRLPHIWPLPTLNHPADLVERLLAAGFETMGSDRMMILADPSAPLARAADLAPAGVDLVRLHGITLDSIRWAPAVAAVLAAAFEVDGDRRTSIELETLAALEGPALNVLLIRSGGEPAAVAKRSTRDGISYLSSIGTRPDLRRQGLGELVTAVAVADALAAGSRTVYLKVDIHNATGQRLYERLGFRAVPGQVDDLLLRR